ncbi:helix-turn-helix transcriptional regulator [Enterobacter sp. Ap-1006]|uniref:AraC family transcriptional regulator n=1 Tax=Enterobacter sp. Ap-1006 TaxID=2608345 RepID=UPI00141FD6E7|nr:helix-turn-helix transcriptional regulator [Enterobacter sp. Ap-1006]NIF48619.1 helix-turn-helix transcriptional regulator [Enterobacter sp. Ap-1006]
MNDMDYFDPDSSGAPIDVLFLTAPDLAFDVPLHSHRRGQLVMPVTGSMTCEVEDEIWMVPSESAMWIPTGLPHRNTPAASATFCFVFIETSRAAMPEKSCTLAVSPLIREMILHLARISPAEAGQEQTCQLVNLLFSMMAQMPAERLNFPLSKDARLRQVASMLLADPADRRPAREWAAFLALSERTFTRLVVKETGLTFGLWRRQLHIVVSLQRLLAGGSVQSVSEQLGYESVSAFITMFKKALGKSPKRYIGQA